jgi:hypothetical protein
MAWLVPAGKDGECATGSKAVTTSHEQLFKFVSEWNVKGTLHGAPYASENSSSDFDDLVEPDVYNRTYDIRDSAVTGEGSDEIINWSSLCIRPSTGEVKEAQVDFDPTPVFDDDSNPDISILNLNLGA